VATICPARVVIESWGGHDFTDYFTLLKVDGRWKIMNNVFSHAQHPPLVPAEHVRDTSVFVESCLNYDLHESNQDPGFFVLYENRRTVPLRERHVAPPHLEAFKRGPVSSSLAGPFISSPGWPELDALAEDGWCRTVRLNITPLRLHAAPATAGAQPSSRSFRVGRQGRTNPPDRAPGRAGAARRIC